MSTTPPVWAHEVLASFEAKRFRHATSRLEQLLAQDPLNDVLKRCLESAQTALELHEAGYTEAANRIEIRSILSAYVPPSPPVDDLVLDLGDPFAEFEDDLTNPNHGFSTTPTTREVDDSQLESLAIHSQGEDLEDMELIEIEIDFDLDADTTPPPPPPSRPRPTSPPRSRPTPPPPRPTGNVRYQGRIPPPPKHRRSAHTPPNPQPTPDALDEAEDLSHVFASQDPLAFGVELGDEDVPQNIQANFADSWGDLADLDAPTPPPQPPPAPSPPDDLDGFDDLNIDFSDPSLEVQLEESQDLPHDEGLEGLENLFDEDFLSSPSHTTASTQTSLDDIDLFDANDTDISSLLEESLEATLSNPQHHASNRLTELDDLEELEELDGQINFDDSDDLEELEGQINFDDSDELEDFLNHPPVSSGSFAALSSDPSVPSLEEIQMEVDELSNDLSFDEEEISLEDVFDSGLMESLSAVTATPSRNELPTPGQPSTKAPTPAPSRPSLPPINPSDLLDDYQARHADASSDDLDLLLSEASSIHSDSEPPLDLESDLQFLDQNSLDQDLYTHSIDLAEPPEPSFDESSLLPPSLNQQPAASPEPISIREEDGPLSIEIDLDAEDDFDIELDFDTQPPQHIPEPPNPPEAPPHQTTPEFSSTPSYSDSQPAHDSSTHEHGFDDFDISFDLSEEPAQDFVHEAPEDPPPSEPHHPTPPSFSAFEAPTYSPNPSLPDADPYDDDVVEPYESAEDPISFDLGFEEPPTVLNQQPPPVFFEEPPEVAEAPIEDPNEHDHEFAELSPDSFDEISFDFSADLDEPFSKPPQPPSPPAQPSAPVFILEDPVEPSAPPAPASSGPHFGHDVSLEPLEEEDDVSFDLSFSFEPEEPSAPSIVDEQPPSQDSDGFLNTLQRLQHDGLWERARDLLQEALQTDPNDPILISLQDENNAQLVRHYERSLGDLTRCPRLLVSPQQMYQLRIDARAGFMLSQIDGFISLEDLIDMSIIPRVETIRILADLLRDGVIGF